MTHEASVKLDRLGDETVEGECVWYSESGSPRESSESDGQRHKLGRADKS